MKPTRLLSLLLCLILTCTLCLPAFASPIVYPLEALGISIEIPEAFKVFTRDYVSDETVMKMLGYTQESLRASYESRAIFLNAYELAYPLKEVVITAVQTGTDDFIKYSDEELLSYGDVFRDQYKSLNAELVSMSIYKTPWNKFLKIESIFPSDSGPDKMTQYTTGFNGMVLNITRHAYNLEPEEKDLLELEEMVKSIRPLFLQANDSAKQGLFYQDDLTGLSFTLPDGWVLYAEAGESTRATRFKPSADPTFTLAFMREEFWTNLSFWEQQGKKRSEFGLDEFVKTKYKSPIGIPDNAEKIHLDSGDYLKWITERRVETNSGITVVPIATLLHVENGYYYGFVAPAGDDDPFYIETLRTINNLVYPASN